ncbi:MAG: S41 family peptidase, partial [Chitinophagaceae bacterium]
LKNKGGLEMKVVIHPRNKKVRRMKSVHCYLLLLFILLYTSCSTAIYDPLYKFSPEKLKEDYTVSRRLLEKFHPSIYWYTSKDSMNAVFDQHYRQINDSMNIQEFAYKIIAPTLSSIHCGHTSFSYNSYTRERLASLRLSTFPLQVRTWNDSMMVTGSMASTDSLIKRGSMIHSINGITTHQILDSLMNILPADGYSRNSNYIRISSGFPFLYRNVFGENKLFKIEFSDSSGKKTIELPAYDPIADSALRQYSSPLKEMENSRLYNARHLEIIDSTNTAIMTVNTFEAGYMLHTFFRKSFRKLDKKNIKNLIIDIRYNGGGLVTHYTHLARYLRNSPFKVTDSSFAVRNKLGSDGRYFYNRLINAFALRLISKQGDDGLFHFGFWERKFYAPHKKHFYTGNTYILTSGPTFSAGSLFAHTIKGQKNITILGEETGGGNYGNNGLLIPLVRLPHTGLRIRMPLFRMVQFQPGIKDGRGVLPDVHVPLNAEAILNEFDLKMYKAKQLIQIK